MKKITLLISLFSSFLMLAQTKNEIIQNHLNQNTAKSKLNSKELSEWKIFKQSYSDNTKINNCTVKQTFKGIEVDQTDAYFWIKEGKIINTPSNFVQGLTSKTNTASPTLDIAQGLAMVSQKLDGKSINATIEKTENNKFKLTDKETPLGSAKLLYIKVSEKEYRLAWNYEFYSNSGNHLWNASIDAVNGKILSAVDLTVNCNFHKSDFQKNEVKKPAFDFARSLYKRPETLAFMTPGTTSYTVVPYNYESPTHYKTAFPVATDGRTSISNPEITTIIKGSIPAASPRGWHNTSGLSKDMKANQHGNTRGNNVYAYEDYDDSDTAGATAVGAGTYPNLTFNFPYGGDGAAPTNYIQAATTNLFYMNNVMHDLWYQYGFDEANGNFQANNYSRGGEQDDYVLAEAQDGSQKTPTPDLNNANFSTPSDGFNPRMQMYLWKSPLPATLNINSGTLSGTLYNPDDNAFSPGHINLPVAPSALTANLQLVDDGSPDNSDACASTTAGAVLTPGSLSGKIAVIRRGTCSFALKVKAVQNAGAIGAIIVNNQAGRISMSGADATITIPAVALTQVDGEQLISAMSNGTVTVSLSIPELYINGDGDFDNGIIAHEYGHGISTRLVGSLQSSEQPGEGWSDFFWLMMQIKPGNTRSDARGIGTYASNENPDGDGIRQYKYSTDMSINPHTFGSTNSMHYTDAGTPKVDVHSVGSVWCVMLWDIAWDYIDKYGYDSNIYSGTGGNNKFMQLAIDALKLTPANPSLIECRDAIIAADQATTNGENYCLIWKAFARRGLGVNASSGTNITKTFNPATGAVTNYPEWTNGIKDQVEDFTEPSPGPNCVTLATNSFENSNDLIIYPNPTKGLINLRLNNTIESVNIEIIDLNGRVVYSKQQNDLSTEKSINLNQLQSGVYIVKVKGEHINYTKKIILE